MSMNLLGASRGVRTYGFIAKTRLRQEFRQLQNKDIPYLASVSFLKRDLSKWQIILEGPPATPYQDRYFEAMIDFPKNYPFVPFKLTWKTKIFHLILQKDRRVLFHFEIKHEDDNNDNNSNNSRDSHDTSWSPSMTVYSILEEFYCMIFSSITFEDVMDYYDPLPETGINHNTIQLCVESPHLFLNTAREYTQKYAISPQNLQHFVHYQNAYPMQQRTDICNGMSNYNPIRNARFGLRDRGVRFSVINNCYVLLVDNTKEIEDKNNDDEEKQSAGNMQQLKSVLEKEFGFYVNCIKIGNQEMDADDDSSGNSTCNIIGERDSLLDRDYDIGAKFLQQLKMAWMEFHNERANYDGFMLIYKGFGSYSDGIVFNSDKEGVENNNVSFYQIKSVFALGSKSRNENVPIIFIFDTSRDKDSNGINTIFNANGNNNNNNNMSLNRRRVGNANSRKQMRCMEIYHTADGNKSRLVEGLLAGLKRYHGDNALNVVGRDGFQIFSVWLKNVLKEQNGDVNVDIHDTIGFDVYLGTQNFHTLMTNRWMDGCILAMFSVAVVVIFGMFF